jgi:hypothetical protein
VTADDKGIGLNCGGYVIVKPIREWFALARPATQPVSPGTEAQLRQLEQQLKRTEELYDAANNALIALGVRVVTEGKTGYENGLKAAMQAVERTMNVQGARDAVVKRDLLNELKVLRAAAHPQGGQREGALRELRERYREQERLTSSTLECVTWRIAGQWLDEVLTAAAQQQPEGAAPTIEWIHDIHGEIEPAPVPRVQERRCQATHPEVGQCELRKGHDGSHLAGYLMWTSRESK